MRMACIGTLISSLDESGPSTTSVPRAPIGRSVLSSSVNPVLVAAGAGATPTIASAHASPAMQTMRAIAARVRAGAIVATSSRAAWAARERQQRSGARTVRWAEAHPNGSLQVARPGRRPTILLAGMSRGIARRLSVRPG